MKKIEIIWRHILYQALEKQNNYFVQQDLADQFSVSTSTVFQALKTPRQMGAVKVGGRGFSLQDPEKLLYHWASIRNLQSDLIYQARVDLPVVEIETSAPPKIVFGLYSAYFQRFKDAPADYDSVWLYGVKSALTVIKQRYPAVKGKPNLFVLSADSYLKNYGCYTSLAQTFVDLWNLDTWYAKEFVNSLQEKINAILS